MNKEILDDNFLPEETNFSRDVDRAKRLGSMILDHAVISGVSIITMGIPLSLHTYFDGSVELGINIFFFAFSIYLNKDIFHSQSIAKRYFGFIVIDKNSKKPASSFQCLVRNFTIPLWPFETLFTLISPHRRLGDLIAGTMVLATDKKSPDSIIKEIKTTNWKILISSLVIAYCYIWVFFNFIIGFISPF